MVVELALAAMIPGLLVGLHYGGADLAAPVGPWIGQGRQLCTPWIVGGVALLGLSGTSGGGDNTCCSPIISGLPYRPLSCKLPEVWASVSAQPAPRLLALLASRTVLAPQAGRATIVWMMMIAGIVVTAIVSGAWLDPFSLHPADRGHRLRLAPSPCS